MKGGVEECIEEKKPDILLNSFLLESEFTVRASGDGKDDDAGDEEADACKKHLASGHVCCNLIFLHSHFDQWVSPSPRDSSRKGEQAYPYRSLKYTECICFFLFHYNLIGIPLLSFFAKWQSTSPPDAFLSEFRGSCPCHPC